MLIVILFGVQYSQKDVFSFEKGSNGQNHSSGSQHPAKKFPSPAKFLIPPTPYHYLENIGIAAEKENNLTLLTKANSFRVTVCQKKEALSLENTLAKLNEEHKQI